MSRLIVKNLPNGLKEDRLRKLFGERGELTDCSLKYTPTGQFRNFAFIGYRNEKDAQTALGQLNQTYIDTKKIQVEVARDFGDANKPRAWSKYSKESSANQRLAQEGSANQRLAQESSANQRLVLEKQIDKEDERNKKSSKKKDKKKRKENEVLSELEDDAGFQEFLEVHQNVGAKPVWTNDGGKTKKSELEMTDKTVDSDDSDDDSEDDDMSGSDDEEEESQESEEQINSNRYDQLLKNYKWKTEDKPWLKEERLPPERCQEIHYWNSVNSKRAVKVRKRQSEQGRPLRKGRWSAGEDDILVENLQRYYKENPMYNPILLLHSAKSNQKLLRTTKETLLYSRIAAGLNRTNSDAYNRARYYLFPNYEYKKGKYSIEEKTEMKKLFGIYGSNCITIGTKLGRNSRGLTRQWEHLQATKFGSWDEIEEQSLIEAVKQCSKAADDMHNYLPWMIIAKAIPGRHSDQCRHHWIHKLRNQVFKEEQCFETVIWEKSQTLELESEICIQGVAYEEDVDFDDIRQHFHKAGFVLTRDQARTQWRNLKRNVKNYYINSFGEILDEIVSHLVTDM